MKLQPKAFTFKINFIFATASLGQENGEIAQMVRAQDS
jgi:hypothetical protein